MSTRSGKRIHGSLHENIIKPDENVIAKSERKTRSKRLKENDEIIVTKSKKRSNYVSYPIDDELVESGLKKRSNNNVNVQKTLQEQDLNVLINEDALKPVRQTRRTKKISENLNEDAPSAEVVDNVKVKKNKKNKRKQRNETEVSENVIPTAVIKKKSKKKKSKKTNSFKEEDITTEVSQLNKSNGSVESFHSAAGSPLMTNGTTEIVKTNDSFCKSPQRASKRLKADSEEDIETVCLNTHLDRSSKKIKLFNVENNLEENVTSPQLKEINSNNADSTFNKTKDAPEVLNETIENESKTRRRSSIKNSTFDKISTPKLVNKLDSTLEKMNTPMSKNKVKRMSSSLGLKNGLDEAPNTSLKKNKKSESNLNETFEKAKNSPQTTLNSTFEKASKQSILNSTYEQPKETRQSCLNGTFEKSKTVVNLNGTCESNKRTSQSLNTTNAKVKETKQLILNSTFDKTKDSEQNTLNSTFEKAKESVQSTLNSTFDKTKESVQSTLNSTFEKSSKETTCRSTLPGTEIKLNSTFEKNENISESTKSSIISSDSTPNVTLDKSDENSRISITSDDSSTENIVNTTPVLIESSMDECSILDPTPTKADNQEQPTAQPSVTPLKREGTFTKEGPDVVSSPKPRTTPVKRMSLPSPGSTPFPFSKSSQKEKCMLNVTRSIEKATRRSSLAEPAQRMTKVMFCSPVNNPIAVVQDKKKIIKSSMKGSNKSFIFDESVSEAARPATRKRSYTQNDADDVRTKRKRLADPQQQSVDRLSRPRTHSATVKASEPSTPSKTPASPLRKAKPPRTKLPNFAALHQRQFDKMESLGESRDRRARRARLLLTPTGARGLIERISPKPKVAEPVKPIKAAKKTDTPTKTPKVPTLMSLRPGYTRFGFKMDLGVNPFSIPPKTEPKAKEIKPNGVLTRQPSQPSLTGATSTRREVAKQTVMREKSFTSLSDKRKVTRTENRSVIKGVRTNRRFELQMKMRNIP